MRDSIKVQFIYLQRTTQTYYQDLNWLPQNWREALTERGHVTLSFVIS